MLCGLVSLTSRHEYQCKACHTSKYNEQQRPHFNVDQSVKRKALTEIQPSTATTCSQNTVCLVTQEDHQKILPSTALTCSQNTVSQVTREDHLDTLSSTLGAIGISEEYTLLLLEQSKNASLENPRLCRWSQRCVFIYSFVGYNFLSPCSLLYYNMYNVVQILSVFIPVAAHTIS